MGACFCGFRRTPNTKRSSKIDSEKENCGPTASAMKLMKPRSLWAAMKVKNSQVRLPEKQELQHYNNNCSKVLTLEDWIVSSPDPRPDYTNISEGETHSQKQSSRKIHPSFDGDLNQELLPKSGDSFSVEISIRACDYADSNIRQTKLEITSIFCRTKIGKMKKKVSFRSPEVADVFVLDHSPEIYAGQ